MHITVNVKQARIITAAREWKGKAGDGIQIGREKIRVQQLNNFYGIRELLSELLSRDPSTYFTRPCTRVIF